MNNKKHKLPLLATAGALLLNLTCTSLAKAYTVNLNGRTGDAGNPDGIHMVDIGLSSRSDIGRTLDPIKFSTVKGTGGGNDVLSENLTGEAVITVLELSRNLFSFDIDVSNATAADNPKFEASLVSLWFGINPSATNVSVNDGDKFTNARFNPNGTMANGGRRLDLCIDKKCRGNDVNKGVLAGTIDSFRVDIHGDFGVRNAHNQFTHNEVVISDFGARWQTNKDGSYEVVGVPEPITVLGSGAAIAFGMVMKRRHGKKLAD